MRSLRRKSGFFVSLIATCVIAFGFTHLAHGQLSALKKAVDSSEPAKAPAPETPDQARARLTQWRQESRDTLSRMDEAGAAVALPAGVSQSDLEDRRRDLDQIVLMTNRSLKTLDAINQARDELKAATADDSAWTGFSEKPPYSVLLIDDLLNDKDSTKDELSSQQAALSNYERILTATLAEIKVAEETTNNLTLLVRNAKATEMEAVKWKLEAARAKSRLLASRAGYIQGNIDCLKDQIATNKADLSLLERKVSVAMANSSFTDKELGKIKKLANDREIAYHKEIDGISKRIKPADATRIQAQAALDALNAANAAEADPAIKELAKFRLEVTTARVEAIQSLKEGLESLIVLDDLTAKAYEYRKSIISASNPVDRKEALDSLASILDRFKAWESVINNDITVSNADLSKLESRATTIASEDPTFALLNEQRAILTERIACTQRISLAVTSQRKLINRWVVDFSPKKSDSFSQRTSYLASVSWAFIKSAWSFEIMTFKDEIVVDGQTISGTIPITLGVLIRALLFFVIGYWVASRIARRIQRSLVTRGHVAEAQARTLRNWGMIVVGVLLVLGTLAFLKIPLTVFAFFGGALAIGIGFGTQTLIKNFISGIIVLAERKVRVGDMLDVEGIIGTVTEINTRSSVIKGPDGVETMIPNSLFLENQVTNWTLTSSKIRRSLRVGVTYGTSPQKAMELLVASAERHGLICKDPEPFAILEDFGDNALTFCLYFWLDLKGETNAMIVASDLRLMLEKHFKEHGIEVPFPQRDMHLTTDKPLQVEWVNKAETKPDPYK